MSNLNLSLTLGLQDKLIGPLQRAVADAERALGALGKSLGQIDASGASAATSMTGLAAKTNALGATQGASKLASDMGQVASTADVAQEKMGRLSAVIGKMPGLVEKASAAFLGLAAAKKIVDVPITAFANLEEANTALKVTMMKKGGAVSGNYGAIQKIAMELGNKLPGTTKDFVGSANELLSLGVSEDAVVHGGLTAAAHLGVVMKMPPQQAAESVAKMREAYGLKDNELPGMADEMQRNRFAFGIRPGDMLQSAKYMAPSHRKCIGIVGTGLQARLQLRYLRTITKCRDVIVWGRSADKLELFTKDASLKEFAITPTTDITELTIRCNLIVTSTASKSALLKLVDILPGTHITAMGADADGKQEIDPALIARADVLVADSVDQCIDHGECGFAVRSKLIEPTKIIALGDVIARRELRRSSDNQFTIADLTGVAIQDIQITKFIFEKHRSQP